LGLFSRKKEIKVEELIEYRKLFEAGKFQEALDLLEKRFDKNSAADWYTKGNALYNLERLQESLDCYEKAIERVPDYTKAWYRAGQTLMTLKEYPKARECFSTVANKEREKKTEDKEGWESASLFGFMLTYIYEHNQGQKDNSNTKEFTAEANGVIKGMYSQLYEKDVIPKFDQINDFIDYIDNNMVEIFNKLEPNIIFEVRVGKD